MSNPTCFLMVSGIPKWSISSTWVTAKNMKYFHCFPNSVITTKVISFAFYSTVSAFTLNFINLSCYCYFISYWFFEILCSNSNDINIYIYDLLFWSITTHFTLSSFIQYISIVTALQFVQEAKSSNTGHLRSAYL